VHINIEQEEKGEAPLAVREEEEKMYGYLLHAHWWDKGYSKERIKQRCYHCNLRGRISCCCSLAWEKKE
jgi:hypothetical protein